MSAEDGGGTLLRVTPSPMASNNFNNFLQKLLLSYLVTGADIRVALLMTNTTADMDKDAMNFVDDITDPRRM